MPATAVESPPLAAPANAANAAIPAQASNSAAPASAPQAPQAPQNPSADAAPAAISADPRAFQPLRDDAVRRGKKFLGIHRTFFSQPGRVANYVVRTYYGQIFMVLLLGGLVTGGVFGWNALQEQWSSDAGVRTAARAKALEERTWPAVSAYVKQYGAKDDAVRKALDSAYEAQADEILAGAETALREQKWDSYASVGAKMAEITRLYTDLTAAPVPDALAKSVARRTASFERLALSYAKDRLRSLASAAETQIETGEITNSVAAWQKERDAVLTQLAAGPLSAEGRAELDATKAAAQNTLARALERAFREKIQAAAEKAKLAALERPAALQEFAEARNGLIEQARKLALPEAALVSLGRDADRHAEDISSQVALRLSDRLDELFAKAQAALDMPEVPIRAALAEFHTQAEVLLAAAAQAGLAVPSLDRLKATRTQKDAELKTRALVRARTASAEELKGLLEHYKDDAATVSSLRRMLADTYIRNRNFAEAEQFSTGDTRLQILFSNALTDYWAKGDRDSALAKLLQVAAATPEPSAEPASASRLDALMQLSQGYVAMLSNGNTKETALKLARLAPAADSPTYPLEAFTVAYFQMIAGDFGAASATLNQVAGKLPEGFPVDYLRVVAHIRQGKGSVEDTNPPKAAPVRDRDRNKLYLLRYAAFVDQQGQVYDEDAHQRLAELISTGQTPALAGELNTEAGTALDADELRFTLGIIRFAYYYQRAAGLGLMRDVKSEPYRRAAGLIAQLMVALYMTPADSPAKLNDGLRKLYESANTAIAGDDTAWPLQLARALIGFHVGFQEQPGSARAEEAFTVAAQRFRQVGEQKPALRAFAQTHQGLIALLRGQARNAQDALQQAISRQPGYAEAYYWLGDAAQSVGDTEQALECYMHAARASGSVQVVYPRALGRMAEKSSDPNVRAMYAEAYKKFYEKADEFDRNDLPAPEGISETPSEENKQDQDDGNSRAESDAIRK